MILEKINQTILVGFLILITIIFSLSISQTKNPDISIISDFRTFTHSDDSRSASKGKFNMDLHEMELAIQGYLNPYARADIYFAKHGLEGDVEIEEASATILRGLPLGLNLKAGKYLVDFGKLNTSHPHAWSFVFRPLMHQYYFGSDGLNDVAINANVLLPTGDVYTKFSVNILKGNYVNPHTHEAETDAHDHADENETYQPPGISSRLSSHLQLTDYSNLEFGISGLTGIHDKEEDSRHYLVGLDIKYKWRPNRYKSLTIQAEATLNSRKLIEHEAAEEDEHAEIHTAEKLSAGGYFVFLDYQFRQRWNVGIMSEYGKTADFHKDEFWAQTAFAGFALMEETTVIRLLLRREKRIEYGSFNTIMAQLVFSLGPHKPHLF